MNQVKVWQETVDIPTYEVGPQDENPMFLEHRVYQGSSGAVYPYGVIDTITGEKQLRRYQAIYLENDYIRIMLLPELGGRIQRAYDKVKQRDFIYYNEVVKPALVGLVGPWISGGIEFNWPQHHRPTTYMPIDFQIRPHESGAQTVWLGEIEPMRGLQVMTGFTLYPHRALVEIGVKIYNGNDTPRHFLWWANPAVKGGDDHQSVFPPDVTAVFDHGKRDVSSFPIAHGTYYKVDYSAGVDISRYKNIPVPTSYMAGKSDYDFVGAYSHDEQGGLLHVADHHVSPGKKQWTWGNGEFGQAWDRNLTDNNGPYIELMTGVFTDNQPDFTWLDAYEEKCFVQNFLPYNTLGVVQNANTEAALKLERHNGRLSWGVYAVSPLPDTRLVIRSEVGDSPLLDRVITLSPCEAVTGDLPAINDRLTIILFDAQGREILSYLEHRAEAEPLPEPARAPLKPAQITSADEAYFIGQHLEQYNHASRSAFDYYQRGLALDAEDYRCNLALATLEYNRADFTQAIAYADSALKRAHRLNSNPQCGKASLIRGCAYERLGRLEPAYKDFYRATWSGNAKEGGFYGLARIATRREKYQRALTFTENSLISNGANYHTIALKALLLHKLDRAEQSINYIDAQLAAYPLNYALYYLRFIATGAADDADKLRQVTGGRGINALSIAGWLVELGQNELALNLLTLLNSRETLPLYLQAGLSKHRLPTDEYQALLQQARASFSDSVRFPNTLTEVRMLTDLNDCAFAQYLLGCFHYSKRNYAKAVALWERAAELEPDFAAVWRNLGIYAFNKQQDGDKAEGYLSRAVELSPTDARLLFELDYLRKLRGVAPEQRLAALEPLQSIVLKRDDLTAELLSLLHICGKADLAARILFERRFHPWEGGEGKITGQYLINLQRRAFDLLNAQQPDKAKILLQQALHYPENLGEGRLVGQSDNDLFYWLAVCAERLHDGVTAQALYRHAAQGSGQIGESKYYNDQPVDYLFYQGMARIKLGQPQQAEQIFSQMLDWADKAKDQRVEADFFAVSLPDLVVLDSDGQHKHRQHCLWVETLAYLGQGKKQQFRTSLQQLLALNPNHDKAHLFSVLGDGLLDRGNS